MSPSRIDRYEIHGTLATGGMAEILLGRVVGMSGFERPVALKRVLPHLASRPDFVRMFLDEARIVARIRHPNVVQVQELGHVGGDLFLVMEYLAGESLSELMGRLVDSDERLDPSLAAYIIAEAAAGLHAAHGLVDDDGVHQNLVHRDVSPQNIFVTFDGHVKIIDFGIAKTLDSTAARTQTGHVKGKFEYMSPEQCDGESLTRQSDLFSLGIVLYEMTTGRRLFKRDSPMAVFRAIATQPVTPPSRLVRDYPAALEEICLRALAIDCRERYLTAAEMRRDLLVEARRLRPDGDRSEDLAVLMRRLFAERIAEKARLLLTMRGAGAPIASAAPPTLERPAVASRKGRVAGAVIGLGLLITGALALGLRRAPSGSNAPSVVEPASGSSAAEAAQTAPAEASPEPPLPAAPPTAAAEASSAEPPPTIVRAHGERRAPRAHSRPAPLPQAPPVASSASPWAKWH